MAFTVAHPDGAESTLSFSGLREDWLSVADYLRDAGIGAGDVLVVNPENHPRYRSLILGAWAPGRLGGRGCGGPCQSVASGSRPRRAAASGR